MSNPDTPPMAFPAELETLAAQARADLDIARNADPADFPAWCRRIAAARRVLAEVYSTARQHTEPGSLASWALYDATRLCDAHAVRLIAQANAAEQEGQ
ncbi:hypothetical protein [Kutzneria sp. 744]|uniref:hypothetical protein n=1 Tax=Kutzneria sp. (strain 744) TaxID=345341 RepID=UPI0003EEB68D|nr:hypothetical protein [Kutzneria sp. 744]EWM14614.1 hypothetical protein KUTG_04918 [Kutzneria sp. 744]